MFKVVFFLWRRADFDRQRFIDYYETRHAVLSHRIVPQPNDFRRNYPFWGKDVHSASGGAVFGMAPFDVMTELFHDNRSGFQAQLDTVTHSPAKELMAQDELNFLNRDQQVLLIVDERGGSGAGSPASASGKLIRYARRARGLGAVEFRDRYEGDAAASIRSAIPGVIEHRRSYPLFDDPMSYIGNWHIQGRPDPTAFPLDLIEEVWLSDAANLEHAREALRSQTDLVDSLGSQVVVVEEHRSDLGRRMAPVAGRPRAAPTGG
jgi:hypothetical protein